MQRNSLIFAGVGILDHFGALDDIGVAQAHFVSGRQTKESLGRLFAKIVLLDVKLARKGHLARSLAWIFGIVDCVKFLDSDPQDNCPSQL